jgi:hypothetical protein
MLEKLTLIKARLTIKSVGAVSSVLFKIRGKLESIKYNAQDLVDKHTPAPIASGLHALYTMPSTPFTWNTNIANTVPSMITLNSKDNKKVMEITSNGDVEWYGKPSEAARILVQSLQMQVETTKGITKAAKRRYYYMACKNLLNKSKTMSHQEFVDFLEKQVYNRESKIIWDALSNEN